MDESLLVTGSVESFMNKTEASAFCFFFCFVFTELSRIHPSFFGIQLSNKHLLFLMVATKSKMFLTNPKTALKYFC